VFIPTIIWERLYFSSRIYFFPSLLFKCCWKQESKKREKERKKGRREGGKEEGREEEKKKRRNLEVWMWGNTVCLINIKK
jgi:hypothetical protein